MESKEFFTTSELAKKLGISRIAVFKKIKNSVIKAQKIGRNFVIYKKDIETFSNDLFKLAHDWVVSNKKFPEEFYCQNSSVFQDRLIRMENLMIGNEATKDIFSLIILIILMIYRLAVIIPTFAVLVRRLHDTNHSGWWYFINLVPIIGAIIIFIFLLQDSQPGENRYGPNPKEIKVN